MSFSRNFKVLAVILAGLVSYPMAAAGKIRFAIGDERKIIDTKGKETDAKTGGKVREKDKIRTGIEAQVIVALPDGSTVSVEENSLVEFTNLNSANGVQTAMTEIKQGKVRFNAQKQKGNSKLQFKTGTATAAIRGTDGIVAQTKGGNSLFGLNTGTLDAENKCGEKGSIQAGEMLVAYSKSCKFAKLKSSFVSNKDAVNKIIDLIDKGDEKALQNLTDSLSKVFENVKKAKVAAGKCTVKPLADTVSTNSVVLGISCAQAHKSIFVNGELAVEKAAKVDYKIDWEPSFIGEKRFDISCVDTVNITAEAAKLGIPANAIPADMKNATVQFDCGNAKTFYFNAAIDSANRANLVNAELDSMNTDVPDIQVTSNAGEVCQNGSLTINGTITGPEFGEDQTIDINITAGNVSKQLSIPGSIRTFSHIVPIKDVTKNWNTTTVVVKASFPSGTSKSETIPVTVSKKCKAINTISPRLVLSASTQKCMATYEIANNENDVAELSIFKDKEFIKKVSINGNDDGRFQLSSGNHTYELSIADQAGNKGFASKTIACYDKNASAYVSINGHRTPFTTKPKRIPKAPPKYDDSLHETLLIKVHNMKGNDFTQIESITVTQEGKPGNVFHRTNANKSIDALDFSVPVSIEYGAKTTFKVKVKLYNGKILENSMTFNYKASNSEGRK